MRKIDLKKGVGESLEFAIIAPIMLAIILFIISLFQIAICEEKLIYATYMGGRAAAISFDHNSAVINAKNTIEKIYAGETIPSVSIDPDDISWEKGNVFLIQVEQELNPVLPFYGNGHHTRQLGMMIEHSHWVELH